MYINEYVVVIRTGQVLSMPFVAISERRDVPAGAIYFHSSTQYRGRQRARRFPGRRENIFGRFNVSHYTLMGAVTQFIHQRSASASATVLNYSIFARRIALDISLSNYYIKKTCLHTSSEFLEYLH